MGIVELQITHQNHAVIYHAVIYSKKGLPKWPKNVNILDCVQYYLYLCTGPLQALLGCDVSLLDLFSNPH